MGFGGLTTEPEDMVGALGNYSVVLSFWMHIFPYAPPSSKLPTVQWPARHSIASTYQHPHVVTGFASFSQPSKYEETAHRGKSPAFGIERLPQRFWGRGMSMRRPPFPDPTVFPVSPSCLPGFGFGDSVYGQVVMARATSRVLLQTVGPLLSIP